MLNIRISVRLVVIKKHLAIAAFAMVAFLELRLDRRIDRLAKRHPLLTTPVWLRIGIISVAQFLGMFHAGASEARWGGALVDRDHRGTPLGRSLAKFIINSSKLWALGEEAVGRDATNSSSSRSRISCSAVRLEVRMSARRS